ncbi:MAG: 4Fe-4S binding protein [Bacteroidales bacterium]|nr:4Fe-4S binding protein [Candidatus Cacconaster scatequi]
MLRKLRITLAAISFALILLLFAVPDGASGEWFGWMADIQFLPAVLAANFVIVTALIIVTLLFGRVYCSVICPLGVMQDIISFFSGKRRGKALRFGYRKGPVLRYGLLILFVVLMVLGLNSIAVLIAPYSAFGRIASIATGTPASIVVALVTFLVVAGLAWWKGRLWCNSICPVGTVLGFFSRFSLFRPVIDTEKCIGCSKCAKKCKASCINDREHSIDYSRCVACMDCISNCSVGAIRYTLRGKSGCCAAKTEASCDAPADNGRRAALSTIGMVAAGSAIRAQERKGDGGLAVIEKRAVPPREVKPVPAGSKGVEHFSDKCVSCQLCVKSCPNRVLRPSSSLENFLQPEMSFENGYCRPECTVCSEVCPAGAITQISEEEKSSIQIGHAVWIAANCVVLTDDVNCGNCARHCPSGAITMVPVNPEDEKSRMVPSVDTEKCIGCGACEHLCPARPFGAIYVEGHLVHKEI